MTKKNINFFLIIVTMCCLGGCLDNSVLSEEHQNISLMSRDEYVNKVDLDLAESIKGSNKQLFHSALENGANPNALLETGGSPLSLSAINLDHYFMTALLEKGGDPDLYKESSKRNLIFEVLGPDRREHLKALLKFSPDLESRDGVENTPLIYAAILSNYASMKLLLDSGAEIQSVNRFGYSALDVINDNATRECGEHSCPALKEVEAILVIKGNK